MSRRLTVFVFVLLALMIVRIATDGFSSELFDGSALLESAFFAALAAYFSGKRCGASSCRTTPSPSS